MNDSNDAHSRPGGNGENARHEGKVPFRHLGGVKARPTEFMPPPKVKKKIQWGSDFVQIAREFGENAGDAAIFLSRHKKKIALAVVAAVVVFILAAVLPAIPGYMQKSNAFALYADGEDFAEAADALAEYVEDNPDDQIARGYLGAALFRSGDYKESEWQFDAAKVVDIDINADWEILYYYALTRRDNATALAAIDFLVESDSRQAAPFLLRGLLNAVENPRGAREDLLRAEEILLNDPDLNEPRLEELYAYATPRLERFVPLPAPPAPPAESAAHPFAAATGFSSYGEGFVSAASSSFSHPRFAAIGDAHAAVLFYYVYFLLAQGMFEEARNELRQISASDLVFAQLRAILLFHEKKFDEAADAFQKIAAEIPDDPDAVLNEAAARWHAAPTPETAAAIEPLYARVLESQAANFAAHGNRGYLRLLGLRWEAAADDLRESASLAPADAAQPIFNLAFLDFVGRKADTARGADDLVNRFNDLLAKAPQSSAARFALAALALRAGKNEAAISEYERLRAARPADSAPRAALIRHYLRERLFALARDEWEKASKEADPAPVFRLLRAQIELAAGADGAQEEAQNIAAELRAEDPDSALWRELQGDIAAAKGDDADAADSYFESLTRAAPAESVAIADKWARAAFAVDPAAVARELSARIPPPDSPLSLAPYARLLGWLARAAAVGGDKQAARAAAARLDDLRDLDFESLALLAAAYDGIEAPDDAAASWRAALLRRPDSPRALRALAAVQEARGDEEGAAQIRARITAHEPPPEDNLAVPAEVRALLGRDQLDEAVRLYAKMASAAPPAKRAQERFNLGLFALLLKRFDIAADAMKKAAEEMKDKEQIARARGKGAVALINSKRYEEALREITQALAIDPDNPTYLSRHALVLRRLGRLSETESAALQLLKIAPATSRAYSILADIYRLQGRFEDAAAAVKRAIRLAPDDPENYGALSEIYSGFGHVERSAMAARAHRRALLARDAAGEAAAAANQN